MVDARRDGDAWTVVIEDTLTGQTQTVRARLVINAAGPWIDGVLRSAVGENDARNVRLVQGSHIVIRRKFEDERAFFFQNRDERIIFAIPYERDFTLIGTTDRDFDENLDTAEISDDEIAYLCEASSEYFAEPVTRDDVVWTYSGVRPLYDDGASAAQEATRDYVLVEEGAPDQGLLINIFGGKITTYRRLAEAVLEKVERRLGQAQTPAGRQRRVCPAAISVRANSTGSSPTSRNASAFWRTSTRTGWRGSTGQGRRRSWARPAASRDLGTCFGSDLYAVEVDYLVENEWAVTADDIVWRRTKRGLQMSEEQISALSAYLDTSKKQKLKAG